MALTDRLKEIRTDEKLHQTEAGALIGMSVGAWHNWENGKSRPSYDTITKIADVFGVSRTWLDSGVGEKKAEEAKKKQEEAERKQKYENVVVYKVEDEQNLQDVVTLIRCLKDINVPKERKRRMHRLLSNLRTEYENIVLFGDERTES